MIGSTIASDADGNTVKVTFVWAITRGVNTCQIQTSTDALAASGSTHSNALNLATTFSTSSCTGASPPATINPSKGDLLTLTVTPNDNTVNGASQASSVTVANTLAVATVSLNTSSPQTNDTLTATATKTDADGDAVSLTFVWKVNGVTKQTTVAAGPDRHLEPRDRRLW